MEEMKVIREHYDDRGVFKILQQGNRFTVVGSVNMAFNGNDADRNKELAIKEFNNLVEKLNN